MKKKTNNSVFVTRCSCMREFSIRLNFIQVNFIHRKNGLLSPLFYVIFQMLSHGITFLMFSEWKLCNDTIVTRKKFAILMRELSKNDFWCAAHKYSYMNRTQNECIGIYVACCMLPRIFDNKYIISIYSTKDIEHCTHQPQTSLRQKISL